MTCNYELRWMWKHVLHWLHGWKSSLEFFAPQTSGLLFYAIWRAYYALLHVILHTTIPFIICCITCIAVITGINTGSLWGSVVHFGILSAMYVVIARPSVMHRHQYVSIYALFRDIGINSKKMLNTYILPVFGKRTSSETSQFSAGFLFLDIVLIACVVWLFHLSLFLPNVIHYLLLSSAPLFPVYQALSTSPLFVFLCMTMLDAGYHVRNFVRAPLRALMIILYNYPLCMILFWVCNGIQALMNYIIAQYYFMHFAELFVVIPCMMCLWINLYIMCIHKQFKVYYDVPS